MPQTDTAPRRVKIAVLIGTLEVGGAELDIVRNFPRLNRDEFEVVVVAFSEAGELAPELERQGIRVIAREVAPPRMARWWFVRRLKSVVYTAGVVPWIGRVLNAEKVDIAHFFLPHTYGYGMLAYMLMRPSTRTVMSRLSLNFYSDTHKILSWLELNVFHRLVDIAVGNSELILDELADEGIPRERLRLLHNGVDPEPFTRTLEACSAARVLFGIEDSAFVIAAVGNLHPYKGHRDLIEAVAQVRDRLPSGWQLIIAGRDQAGQRRVLEALIGELGLAENVRLLGACDDVPAVLLAADVFAHPSHHEGLPNALVEAMAASLPVIGTSVGGIPEAVTVGDEDSETGWLVPPESIETLAEALAHAAEQPDRRVRMGERGRARVLADFSLDKSVATYESIYRELSKSIHG